jgi:hypothetical protein
MDRLYSSISRLNVRVRVEASGIDATKDEQFAYFDVTPQRSQMQRTQPVEAHQIHVQVGVRAQYSLQPHRVTTSSTNVLDLVLWTGHHILDQRKHCPALAVLPLRSKESVEVFVFEPPDG